MPRALVDSHIHFWDPGRIRYPWLAHAPAIAGVHLPSDLIAQAADFDLQSIVFVECDCAPEDRLTEVAWVTELAAQEPRIQTIVASAAIEQGEGVRDHLRTLSRDFPLVRGIRRLIQGEAPGFCVQPDFVRGVQMLPEYGFSFDICIYHPQMADAIQLVSQCPDVSFVLDHFGKPGVKAGLMQPWADQLRQLAAYPNVMLKVSGLATEADHKNWTREQLRPYIDHALTTFGMDRVFYGGDWPVSTQAIAYPTWIGTLEWATDHLSEADRHKLFVENARRFYRIH
jgi:L-fuconolactonase